MMLSPTSAASSTEPQLGPTSARAEKSRARVRYNMAMKWLRRVHLFAGLFMTPWVFLYGITGFLFNHPETLSDREVHFAGRSELAGTALEEFPNAKRMAEDVVAALNARGGGGDEEYRLVDRDSATLSRTLFVTATGDGGEHSVRFDPDSAEIFVRSSVKSGPPAPRWPGGAKLALPVTPHDRLARGVPEVLTKLGVKATEVAVRTPPELLCTVEREGRRWHVAYNIETGAISGSPVEEQSKRLSSRLFLTRMHLAYTYPSQFDARWFWAIAVDAMFVSMVFWGFSGLLMWWQMKKLRAWGAVTLVLSVLAATALALGMHEVLSFRA